MILAQAHVSFTVSDIERSKKFYGDLLGLPQAYEMVHTHPYTSIQVGYPDAHLLAAGFYLGDPESHPQILELLEYVQPTGTSVDMETRNPGTAHLAMYVDDIWEEYERLSAAGVVFRSEPVTVEAGVNLGTQTVYFRDPDNVTLEFMQRPKVD